MPQCLASSLSLSPHPAQPPLPTPPMSFRPALTFPPSPPPRSPLSAPGTHYGAYPRWPRPLPSSLSPPRRDGTLHNSPRLARLGGGGDSRTRPVPAPVPDHCPCPCSCPGLSCRAPDLLCPAEPLSCFVKSCLTLPLSCPPLSWPLSRMSCTHPYPVLSSPFPALFPVVSCPCRALAVPRPVLPMPLPPPLSLPLPLPLPNKCPSATVKKKHQVKKM